MFPVRENVNFMLLEIKTLTNYAGIGFMILFIKYLSLLNCMFYSNHMCNPKGNYLAAYKKSSLYLNKLYNTVKPV
jgi:hypothetical protein